MAMANRRRRSSSPPSTASMSRSTIAADPPPYFLPELIPEVARRLTSLQDFFALRAACRALLPLTPSNLASQAPLLLVPSDDATPCPSLFHLPLRRTHRFRLPCTSRARAEHVVTEFHPLGCRIAISNSYATSLPKHEFSIVHLLTGERVCLPSPPGDFSHVISSGDLVVAWSYQDIFYYRFGTPEWRVVSTRYRIEFRDLILVKDTLYALTLDQRVAIVVLPDNNNGLKLALLERGFDIQEHSCVYSLAECRGELLLVTIIQRSKGFYVLQWQSGDRKWVRITSLGGCTLFIAGARFYGYLGPDHPGIRGDCIYYTSSHVCLVFSLIDQSLDQVATCVLRQEPYRCTPSWVFPSMS